MPLLRTATIANCQWSTHRILVVKFMDRIETSSDSDQHLYPMASSDYLYFADQSSELASKSLEVQAEDIPAAAKSMQHLQCHKITIIRKLFRTNGDNLAPFYVPQTNHTFASI